MDADQLVRSLIPITFTFCSALLLVGLLGVFVIVPEPTVSPTGLLLGAALALVSWFAPSVVLPRLLTSAGRRGVEPARVAGVVRALVFVGLALAEVPALVGLALTFALSDGNDVAPFALAIPVAIASIWVNVSGPTAVRSHLERVRSSIAY